MTIRILKAQKINGMQYAADVIVIGLDKDVEARAIEGGGAVLEPSPVSGAGKSGAGNSAITVIGGDSNNCNNNFNNGLAPPATTIAQEKLWGLGWFTDLNARLGGVFKVVRNAALPGDTTVTAVARNAQDILAYKPSHVIDLWGTNDLGQDIPLATTLANLTTLYDSYRAIGAFVHSNAVFPNNLWESDPIKRAKMFAINSFKRNYWAKYSGGKFHDTFTPLANTNGLGGFTDNSLHPGDGTHIGVLGASTAALGVLSSYQEVAPKPTTRTLKGDTYDATYNPYGNWISNPDMVGAGVTGDNLFNATGTAATFQGDGGGTSQFPPPGYQFWVVGTALTAAVVVTQSRVPRADIPTQFRWRVKVDFPAQAPVVTTWLTTTTSAPLPAGINAGDDVDIRLPINLTALANCGAMRAVVRFRNGGTEMGAIGLEYAEGPTVPPTTGDRVYTASGKVPAGALTYSVFIEMRSLTGQVGSYTMEISLPDIRKAQPV